MRRHAGLLFALLLAAPACLLWALATGSVGTSAGDLLAALDGDPGAAATVIRELRLPRALAAFAVGGLLALAGCLLQVLLRNPLADPYVLGVSGGAATGALLAMLLGVAASAAAISASALAGALAAMLLVFTLSRAGGRWTPDRLLLTGVVAAAGFGAIISLLLTLSPPGRLPGMLFWLLGDLANSSYPGSAWAALLIGLVAALSRARALNVLARGEQVAATLGEDTVRLRWFVYLLTALLTAAAVTVAGPVGFVGLVIPHVLRLLGMHDHRLLLPGAALLGGSFLVVADTLARSLAAPVQLPVGAITALLGVPAFLYLLVRGSRP